MNTSKVYSFNYKTGQLEPIAAAGLLPVGSVVTYQDRANPCKKYVVTGADLGTYGHGQKCLCEDGHESTVSAADIAGPGGWENTGEVLNAAQIAEFRTAAQQRRAEAEAEQAKQAAATETANANQRAAWLKEYHFLETVKPGQYASAKHGAANIRQQLKRAFPGVKFSVRSDTFSGGDSIDISWELGPTKEQVEAITNKYQEGSFNGMDDIYETNHSNIWPDIYGGAKYVHTHRDTDKAEDIIAPLLCARWGVPVPADRAWWTVRRANDYSGHDVGVIARQIIMAQAYPVGAVITGIEDTGETCGQWHEIIRATYTAPTPNAAQAETSATVGGSLDIQVRHNSSKKGIEIVFAAKPAAAVLADLKAAGWRWSHFSGCWYHRADESAARFAAKIANFAPDEIASLLGKLTTSTPDAFDMQVEDNMSAACGL